MTFSGRQKKQSRKLNFLPLHFNPRKGYDLGNKVYAFSRVLTSRGNGWPVVAELLGASETLPSIFAHQQSIQEEQEMSPLPFPGGAGVKFFCCLLQSKHLLFVKPSLHNQTRHLSKEKKIFPRQFYFSFASRNMKKKRSGQSPSYNKHWEPQVYIATLGPLLTPTIPSPYQVPAFTVSLFWTTSFLPFQHVGTSSHCLSLVHFMRCAL